MGILRSEQMRHGTLVLPVESAKAYADLIGSNANMQFEDMNANCMSRPYKKYCQRIDEMERIIRFLTDELARVPGAEITTTNVHDFLLHQADYKLEDVESRLLHIYKHFTQFKDNSARLVEKRNAAVEERHVVQTATASLRQSSSRPRVQGAEDDEDFSVSQPLLGNDDGNRSAQTTFSNIAGVIPQADQDRFARALFRATRGNMFLKLAHIEGKVNDPALGTKMEKSVFVVFFAGERARTKILKLCEAVGANRYPFPEDRSRQRHMNAEVNSRLRELHVTLEAGTRQSETLLGQIAQNLADWNLQVSREKAVYHTLNKLSIDVTRKCLIAEGWCPTVARRRIVDAIDRATYQSSAQVNTIFKELNTKEMPPTFFQTNKVTEVFQDIVEAYGVARYREVNPAVFTIVTFPFLFAVMFGDLGHGLLMLMVGAFMVIYEKKLQNVDNEIFNMVYAGRYCILLMSMFSIYTGILYNEVFSMPMTLFGESHFVCPSDHSLPFSRCPEGPETGVAMNPAYDTPYPFGVDPVWHGTKTELQFTNSMKMKMSVIMGVVQMTCGIFLSALNHRQSKDRLSMMYEFIPQVLFLSSMFGYLSILIMMKWTMGTREAPIKADLYHVMIYMFLQPGNVDCTNSLTGVAECPENLMFAGQGYLQLFLLLVMFVCVPMMLFPKPLILKKRHEARNASGFSRLEDDDDDDHHGGHGGEEFVFSDVLVHQIIHTIEFVLGAVSNTASYLRLWALSLAHAQLSAVFWERILMMGISIGNPVVMVVCFFMWAMTTLGVLMAMESLSAFLHALRLHWVEFQNKFYQGDGYKFVAFSFVDAGKELTGTA